MEQSRSWHRARIATAICVALLGLTPRTQSRAADTAPDTRPAVPALEQLNRESIALYQSLQGSILRVQMPAPRWAGNAIAQQQDDPRWGKYPQLSPNVKNALRARGGAYANPGNYSNTATQPTGNSAAPNGPGGYGGNTGQQPAQVQTAQPTGPQQQVSAPQQAPASDDRQQQRRVQQVQQQLPAQDNGPAQNSASPAPGYNDGNGRAQGITIVVPPPQAQNVWNVDNGQQAALDNRLAANRGNWGFAANNIGLLLDDEAHVLVPMYIEREAIADQPVKLAVGDAESIDAKFVGSDQQTQLTVLQVSPPSRSAIVARDQERHRAAKGDGGAAKAAAGDEKKAADLPMPRLGRPLKLSGKALPEGSIVLVLSPADPLPVLSVWKGAAGNVSGVIVTIDGEIAGIARGGQFLSGSACQLIADQIIRHGAVKRATLGVIITQVDAADGGRQLPADLADKPTLRVDQVIKGSVAEQGGVRQGDLILAVGKEPVHDIPSLAAAIAARQGETKLKVLRDGTIVTLVVNLVQR